MPEAHDDICDVPGILIGHDTNLEAATGCTVLRCEWPALGAVDVRGGAPATRETDLLDPRCFMQEVHAVLLTGGSAFGLDAASGVMRALETQGVGFDAGAARVPIVPAAALFDLGLGRADVRPDAESGMRAVAGATGGPVAQGSVGAGTGATVGKLAGPQWSTKGGLGSASAALPDGHIVGALAAVNAAGDVYDETNGHIVAGTRRPDGGGWLMSEPASGFPFAGGAQAPVPGTNTTLAVVATDAPMTKADLGRVARMAHDGLARAVRPVHSPLDGDVVFALSSALGGTWGAPVEGWPVALAMIGALAAQVLSRAVVKAVLAATGLHGVPAARDMPFSRSPADAPQQ
jgi:L-aminopeptidase/D-esterase-like protein